MSADRYVGAVEASDWCTRHAVLNVFSIRRALSVISQSRDRHEYFFLWKSL